MQFAKIGEKDVTRAIIDSFLKSITKSVESDVIVVGGGPSGLMAARELSNTGLNTLVVEQNNYLGGGFWIGGYLMNKVTFRHPAEKILQELEVPYEEYRPGLLVSDGPYATSKLIAAACEAGVHFLQLTSFDDLVLRNGQVVGVVVNWTPVQSMPRQITCVDPVALEAKIVIDATGHEARVVKKLEERGLIKTKGMGAMWVEASEDAIVEHAGLVYPGLMVTGMAVSEVFGLPRMGPTFGAMLMSGRRVAELVKEEILVVSKR